jgi:hypothetical protein
MHDRKCKVSCVEFCNVCHKFRYGGLCCLVYTYSLLCRFWCPEIGTSSINFAQLNRLLPEDGDNSVSEMLFLNKKTGWQIKSKTRQLY